MKAHLQAIEKITVQLEKYEAAATELRSDLTFSVARSALADAVAAKDAAEIEDITVDAEEMIDRRIDARRAVEVAELRLARAERSSAERWAEIRPILKSARSMTANLLGTAAEAYTENLKTGFMRLLGDDFVFHRTFCEGIVYQKAQPLYQLSRSMKGDNAPKDPVREIKKAFAMIEAAYAIA